MSQGCTALQKVSWVSSEPSSRAAKTSRPAVLSEDQSFDVNATSAPAGGGTVRVTPASGSLALLLQAGRRAASASVVGSRGPGRQRMSFYGETSPGSEGKSSDMLQSLASAHSAGDDGLAAPATPGNRAAGHVADTRVMPEKSQQNLLIERRERVAIVTVSRPDKLNALNVATLRGLDAAFEGLEDDADVGGVVITGAGARAFVAGADITELPAGDAAAGTALSRAGQSVFDRIERFCKPVVAAVNGFALGGGLELALACHVRLASDNARFGAPEVRLGVICGYGGTQRLPRLVGRGRALEMLLTGEPIDAQEALRIGLVNRVVSQAALLEESEALVRKMAANGPLALRRTLEAVRVGADMPMETAQAHEATLFGSLCLTDDMKEGTRAFIEKRPARFQGK
jgi:enoyl-CoA hydratase